MRWFALLLLIVALLNPAWGSEKDDSDEVTDYTSRYAQLASPVPEEVNVQELLKDLASRSACCGK